MLKRYINYKYRFISVWPMNGTPSAYVYIQRRMFIRANTYWLSQLGDGLIYEAADDSNIFPHFYGPSRSFSPLPLDAVVKAEKLTLSDGKFNCSLLN